MFTGACAILGMSEGCSLKEYKAKYRKLASQYHPDKVQHLPGHIKKAISEEMACLNVAMETIKKKIK